MATASRTLTVNAAFFQEIKEVNHDLLRSLNHLRRQCERPSAILNHPKMFLSCCEEALDQLALHFSLEEAYGYFEDPVEVAPRFCDQALNLRAQHGQLYLQLAGLVELAKDLQGEEPQSELIRKIVNEYAEFFATFQRHENEENELILHEYSDDVGVGD